MTCNICGAEIPAGASNCPICGAPAAPAPDQQGAGNPYSMTGGNAEPSNPFGAMQQPQGMQGYDPAQQGYDPAQQGFDPSQGYDPYNPQQMNNGMGEPKKSKTGLIIGIVAAVIVIAGGLIACFAFGVFGGGGGKDGKYYLENISSGGITMDKDMLSAYGIDLSSMYLEVKGEKATLSLEFMGNSESADCEIKFDGSTVTLTKDGQSINGTYDEGEKSISINIDGSGMTFKKK